MQRVVKAVTSLMRTNFAFEQCNCKCVVKEREEWLLHYLCFFEDSSVKYYSSWYKTVYIWMTQSEQKYRKFGFFWNCSKVLSSHKHYFAQGIANMPHVFNASLLKINFQAECTHPFDASYLPCLIKSK